MQALNKKAQQIHQLNRAAAGGAAGSDSEDEEGDDEVHISFDQIDLHLVLIEI